MLLLLAEDISSFITIEYYTDLLVTNMLFADITKSDSDSIQLIRRWATDSELPWEL